MYIAVIVDHLWLFSRFSTVFYSVYFGETFNDSLSSYQLVLKGFETIFEKRWVTG